MVSRQASQRTSLPATPAVIITQTRPATKAAAAGDGKPWEIALVRDFQGGIETRQTQSRAGAVDECRYPAQTSKVAQRPFINDQRRRRTETDHVRKRVVLCSEGRLSVGHTRHPPIQAIEHHGDENRHRRALEIALHRLNDGKESGKQRRRRKQVGQYVNTAPLEFRIEQRLAWLAFDHCWDISVKSGEKDTPFHQRRFPQ